MQNDSAQQNHNSPPVEGGLSAQQKAGVVTHAPHGVTFSFPIFRVVGASRETGMISVFPDEDMLLIPADAVRMIPLENPQGHLAYQFFGGDYGLNLTVTQAVPRVRARTYSCYRIEPALLSVYYELAYLVEEARVDTLSFLLPAEVTDRPMITGLNFRIRERNSELVEVDGKQLRRWTVQLVEPMRGELRLAVQVEKAIVESKAVEPPRLVAAQQAPPPQEGNNHFAQQNASSPPPEGGLVAQQQAGVVPPADGLP